MLKNRIFQSIVLHAHLPFVRHPEYPSFFEENWLYEAISECYLPLIKFLHHLENCRIRGSITLTLTPTLAAMLGDELLLSRYSDRLNRLIELAALEIKNKAHIPEYRLITHHYQNRLTELQHLFEEQYNRNILGELCKLRKCGRIEIIGCAATHALLALIDDRRIIKAQVETGLHSYETIFGERPRGIWMPECAYTPLVSEVIKGAGCEYSIVDSHGILHSNPRPKYGVFAPVRDSNELILFGRDPESSKQVWSAETGYPGDYNYREFYRDLGWDADAEYIAKYLVTPDLRHDLGFKYHRITGNTSLENKAIYNPDIAEAKAEEHGRHFVQSRIKQGNILINKCGTDIHLLSPYDAELFGHWWYEGPIFLESVLTHAANSELELITPSNYIDLHRELQQVEASISSWGNNGYFETWLNGTNDWMYPELRSHENQMQELCKRFPEESTSPVIIEALQQAGRELLLAQSSDWAFIMTNDTTVEYATKRVTRHLENFDIIYKMLQNQTLNSEIVTKMFARNNIFPDLDYRIFV